MCRFLYTDLTKNDPNIDLMLNNILVKPFNSVIFVQAFQLILLWV